MATTKDGASRSRTYFEQQRELLVGDVAASLENVLQNINKLNRSLEGIIAVGNEFSQVEGLWSHIETVTAKETETQKEEQPEAKDAQQGEKR